MTPTTRRSLIQRTIVTAEQMRKIEARVFAAGMPVAALMEKVGGLLASRIEDLFPLGTGLRVGVLVGPGHNGGDALVVARELHCRGYSVLTFCPFLRQKELTRHHAHYCASLNIPATGQVMALRDCDLLIDGLFGFGLERSLDGELAISVDQINQWAKPVVSIDLPSGVHTDTGEVLGTAIRATHTLCLGAWKQGLLQDPSLDYVGKVELIDFDLPVTDLAAVLGTVPLVQRVTAESAIAHIPLCRPAATHKYRMGHLLLICGSRRYAGAAILTSLGARASGVGMLSIAVPASLKPILTAQLPEALVLDCPETETGAIAQLPQDINLGAYNAIACGPGLTTDAHAVVQTALTSNHPLVLDADGLNILAALGAVPTLQARLADTILTPHLGEFKRLFPDLAEEMSCRVTAVQTAAQQTGAVVLLKGARVAIANAEAAVRINPESTAALARGGSGDVLTGLLGGLLAQASAIESNNSSLDLSQAAVWWHAQAGILAMQERTMLGVDASTLARYLIPALTQSGQVPHAQ
jgi:NAD(P)H-hydrate epimerase